MLRSCPDDCACCHTETEVVVVKLTSHPVTVYWHQANWSQRWPLNTRRQAGQSLKYWFEVIGMTRPGKTSTSEAAMEATCAAPRADPWPQGQWGRQSLVGCGGWRWGQSLVGCGGWRWGQSLVGCGGWRWGQSLVGCGDWRWGQSLVGCGGGRWGQSLVGCGGWRWGQSLVGCGGWGWGQSMVGCGGWRWGI